LRGTRIPSIEGSRISSPRLAIYRRPRDQRPLFISIVALHAVDKGPPFRAQTPPAGSATIAFEKNARTGLSVLEGPARPVHVRHDISRWDAVSLGQVRRQARCSVD